MSLKPTSIPEIECFDSNGNKKVLDVGDTAVIPILTKTDEGVLSDPATLVVDIQPRGSAKTTYTWNVDTELVRSDIGTFELRHPITVGAIHLVRAITTGAVPAAEPAYFKVRPQPIV